MTKLRQTWGIPPGVRIALVPGRIAPWNGHIMLAKAARILADQGMRGVTFVLVGDDRLHRRFARKFWKEAQAAGVDALFRMVGHHADMPAAYAAADIVVVPYTSAPIYGRVVAEAQAMAKPVIASSVGPLPENMMTPPRVADELRTGWEVAPGDPAELAKAISAALALDADGYRAMRRGPGNSPNTCFRRTAPPPRRLKSMHRCSNPGAERCPGHCRQRNKA